MNAIIEGVLLEPRKVLPFLFLFPKKIVKRKLVSTSSTYFVFSLERI